MYGTDLLKSSQISYDMSLTVDEQLFFIKVKCKFTWYIPKTRPSSIPLGEFVVLKLVEPFTQCWRHVTTDNFFTSAYWQQNYWQNEQYYLGLFGVIEGELPKLAKSAKDELERFPKILYKSSNCTLIIYKSKPIKKVTILSSKHKRVQIRPQRNKITKTCMICKKYVCGKSMKENPIICKKCE
ncbi:piggyBac transposable element-derived protein 4-like [Vespula squamosa]|uniref:PiggyBac transposable element-derived protein 4-like n=1 Tax=Vespula squamosa TaxID=30214 RepID=A0ABD1ZUA0_VESSQ